MTELNSIGIEYGTLDDGVVYPYLFEGYTQPEIPIPPTVVDILETKADHNDLNMSNYVEMLDGNMSNYVGNVGDDFKEKCGISQASVNTSETNVNSIIGTETIDLSGYLSGNTVVIVENNGAYTYKLDDIMVGNNSVLEI